jgi:uncharacterized membrane protein YkvA (DUF1232 family)
MAWVKRLREWARLLKRDTYALYLAARDPRTPWYVKALAAVVVAYAFSPLDLIPDFIPVLGYLDDLIIVPAGILLAVKLIPDHLMREFRAEAIRREKPTSRAGMVAIVLIWLTVAAFCVWLFWPGKAR